MAFPQTLHPRALNRALLQRQMLLHRSDATVSDALETLVGMQAQQPDDPYYGLRARLEGFDVADLAELVTTRRVVRMSLMRGTIHMVTARDGLVLRPVVRSVSERDVYANQNYGKERLDGLDIEAVLESGRALLAEGPRTAAQLREDLGVRWPDRDPAALAYAVRGLLPLVHVPPRGVWGVGGPIALQTVEAFLGKGVAQATRPDEMVIRYLAAFGPATAADIRTWSGLTGLREVITRLRPDLRTFRNERGQELLDVPDGALPDPDTTAQPRFLPVFDNVLLSHADRTRIISEDDRRRLQTPNAVGQRTFLLDGFVAGTWQIEQEDTRATLMVHPLGRLAANDAAALEAEGKSVLDLVAPQAVTRSFRIAGD